MKSKKCLTYLNLKNVTLDQNYYRLKHLSRPFLHRVTLRFNRVTVERVRAISFVHQGDSVLAQLLRSVLVSSNIGFEEFVLIE